MQAGLRLIRDKQKNIYVKKNYCGNITWWAMTWVGINRMENSRFGIHIGWEVT